MKVLVSVDIEGVAGVVHAEQARPGNPEYERARRWMTQEADAAIRGAFDGGADEVWVNDSHGGFRNLILDALDSRAQLVTGKPRYLSMVAGVEGCDAVLMVGYHAGAGQFGVMSHTISGFAFRRITVNGIELNEAGLYGALAGEYGVPVGLICGDDVFLAQSQGWFPGVQTVQTKVATGHASCVSLSSAQSCAAIQAAAARAVSHVADLLPFRVDGPRYVCELITQTSGQADLFCQWPTFERVEGTALRFEGDSMEAVIRMLNCCSAMSFMLR